MFSRTHNHHPETPPGYRLLLQCPGIHDEQLALADCRRIFGAVKCEGALIRFGVFGRAGSMGMATWNPSGGISVFIPLKGNP
jgi:hypothetical protein